VEEAGEGGNDSDSNLNMSHSPLPPPPPSLYMGSSADSTCFHAWVSLQAGLTDFFPLSLHGSARYTHTPAAIAAPRSGRKSRSAVGTLPPLVGPGPVGPALVASEIYVITAPHLCRTDTTPSTRTGLPAFFSQLSSPHRFSAQSWKCLRG
jgi:hypothetical protein